MPNRRTQFFTPLQVAERTGFTISQVQRAIQKYQLPARRQVNGRSTVTLRDLEAWQKEKQKPKAMKAGS